MKNIKIILLIGLLIVIAIILNNFPNIKMPNLFWQEKTGIKNNIGIKIESPPKINTGTISGTGNIQNIEKSIKSSDNIENKNLSIYEINKISTKCKFPIYDIGKKKLKDIGFHFIKIEDNIISLNGLEFQKVKLGLQEISLAECFTLGKMLDENKYIIGSDEFIYFISKDKLKEQKILDISKYIKDKKDKNVFLNLFNILKINKSLNGKGVIKFYLTTQEDINKLKFLPIKYKDNYYYVTYTTGDIKQQIIPVLKLFNKYKKEIYSDFQKQRDFYKKNGFKKMYVKILKGFNYDDDFYKKYLEYGGDISNGNYIYNQVLFGKYKGKIVCNGIVDYFYKLGKFLGIKIVVENGQAIVYDESIKGYIKAPHSWFKIKNRYFDPTFDLSRVKAKRNIVFYNISPKCFYINHIKQENKDNSFEIIKNFNKTKKELILKLNQNKCYNGKGKDILFFK